MNSILEDIVSVKKATVSVRKKAVSPSELIKRIESGERRDFKKAVGSKFGVNIIAEIKKASQSEGIISENFDPAGIARQYSEGGAAAISVLTEEKYFKGDLSYLVLAKRNSTVPILCKDFIVDPYQLLEAAANGADAALLIAAILEQKDLEKLIKEAEKIGLCPLVEVHDEYELSRVLNTGAEVIGINNRNLKTLDVNVDNALKLLKAVPQGKTVVVESGIRNNKDIKSYLENGVNAFLVGETLMRSTNIYSALKELKNG